VGKKGNDRGTKGDVLIHLNGIAGNVLREKVSGENGVDEKSHLRGGLVW